MRHARSFWIASLFLLPLIVPPAMASQYPDKPVRVLVGFPAGGSADIVARMVTGAVAKTSKFEFVVENRSGAGGNIAFDGAANAAPDGYTLLFSTPGVAINPSLYRKVSFTQSDFTPITLVGEAPLMLMVRPSLGIKTLAGLIKESRKDPEAIRFASSGSGSSSHLAAEVLRSMSGMQYLHVPYRGGGAAMTDLIGDRVDMTVLPIAESMPYVNDKKLLALGQTGSRRSAIAPDVPTIAQAGVDGYSVTTWYMLLGPKNLPEPIVNALYEAFSQVVGSEDLKKSLEARGVDVINADPQETAEFLKQQSESWAKAIEASGTKLD
ncbi:Bug family tripartite tricarboxylate transporter substrate binding protein [Pollutimonas bauzanensis]|uniref:Tripartite-type tricarboxylate transporter, receptor component TctC n=1 Tax=Pollutimonas bauzanensis TaxID=658167 RepID=A0A1M5SHU7_9BURK|nr:tripartite tricarboxylate transporter substrate binding protein [Pollutimonas bauzanensis]SHH38167.1 Tripartite-type tricarboxylate transporter, receptor component TctC [Pollutimonas bauzanensis]